MRKSYKKDLKTNLSYFSFMSKCNVNNDLYEFHVKFFTSDANSLNPKLFLNKIGF